MSITLRNLSAGYERHPAVHHISGTFADGSLTAMVGPNGGGKSTLLKALVGFLPPMSGSIDYGGVTPREIAYLPQQSEIDRAFPLSVAEVAAFGHWPRMGAFRGLDNKQKEAVARALVDVGMGAFADRPIEALSSGQWQRVLFARLIVQDARVLLLDEPFAAIDPRSAHDLTHILQNWHGEGRTIIAVMHDMNSVREHFPEALMLARELVAWGKAADVLKDENLARAREMAEKRVTHAEACERGETDERRSA
ncbi:MAG TPA: ABC transporter ATP-binding protein [Alphaproteobacteria bacterium]|nr:ABC transporter ATP-binding protein [Alphaproteobacteria bacterium]